ncbi:CocE/NonD family hydrolase [Paenarthrobacter sp. NPDC089322]|uniref:alpha/beta hydrolase n=1 Tax=Paenarthrobacter sp. NPDC089322 TaxID=3155065 RepID=UPI003422B3CC
MTGAGTTKNPVIYPPLNMPNTVARSKIEIWSQGIRLDGDLYRPKQLSASSEVPAVVLCHGVGGDKRTAERYAAAFAEDGMIALCFSQAGWGTSDGRLYTARQINVPSSDRPEETIQIREARELIDPVLWADGCRSALDYLEGEQNVDRQRMGLWGTSYGGGISASVAAVDSRVKALAVQVPALAPTSQLHMEKGAERAIQIARGEIPYVPQGDSLPGLRGTPLFERMGRFNVADQINDITVPTLIIDAGDEELFDISTSGEAAHNKIKSNGVDSFYEVIPNIGHYGIYFDGFSRGCELARGWFAKYL